MQKTLLTWDIFFSLAGFDIYDVIPFPVSPQKILPSHTFHSLHPLLLGSPKGRSTLLSLQVNSRDLEYVRAVEEKEKRRVGEVKLHSKTMDERVERGKVFPSYE